MTEAEIAWAAGLYEGEGTVGLTPTGVQLKMAMCDEDVIRRWGAAVGMGKPYGPHTYQSSKPQYEWRINNGDDVIALLELFRPWLGKRRIEQFERTIANRQPVPRGVAPGPECGYYEHPTACSKGYHRHLRRRESPCVTCRKSTWLYQKHRRAVRLGITP